jgi:hypothetical protein
MKSIPERRRSGSITIPTTIMFIMMKQAEIEVEVDSQHPNLAPVSRIRPNPVKSI